MAGHGNERCSATHWHWASAVYRAEHTPPVDDPLLERIVFVFKAVVGSDTAVFAHDLAIRKEHGYTAADGSWLDWRLVEVERIELLFDEEIEDGAEVFWEFLSPSA